MKKKFNITEEDLVELLKDGDEKGLEVLYQNYAKALYNVIYYILRNQELSEEVLQDAFLKIWQDARSYDKSKGTIFTWMLHISRNAALEKTRSKDFKQEPKQTGTEANTLVETSALGSDNASGVNEVVEKLKPELREVIEMVFLKGLTQVQAADSLRIPLGAVKTRSRNAILELRKIIAALLLVAATWVITS